MPYLAEVFVAVGSWRLRFHFQMADSVELTVITVDSGSEVDAADLQMVDYLDSFENALAPDIICETNHFDL